MTRIALISVFVLVGAAAEAADPATDEVKKLQGDWQVVEVEKRGRILAKDDEAKNVQARDQGQRIDVPS